MLFETASPLFFKLVTKDDQGSYEKKQTLQKWSALLEFRKTFTINPIKFKAYSILNFVLKPCKYIRNIYIYI